MKVWFIDLAFVDKLAKESNGSNYLLDRQNLFGWIVDVKTKEEKTFQGDCKSVLNQDCKKNCADKSWVEKGQSLQENFESFVKLKQKKFT